MLDIASITGTLEAVRAGQLSRIDQQAMRQDTRDASKEQVKIAFKALETALNQLEDAERNGH